MPKVQTIQTNFTGGEMSPKLSGRVDIAKYNNCAKELTNVVPLIFGGAESRDGTLMIASSKNPDKKCRLIPFVFNVSQSYVLEFGDLYMRVFANSGQVEASPGVPYEIETEITLEMLPEINYAQSADVMILVHEALHPQRLMRLGHADWVIGNLILSCPPLTDDHRIYPDADLSIPVPGGVGGMTFTASDAVFSAGDLSRRLHGGGGVAVMSGSIAPFNTAPVDVTTPFNTDTIPAGEWYISGRPIAPDGKIRIGSPSGDFLLSGQQVSISLDSTVGFRPEDHGAIIVSTKNRSNDLGDLVVEIISIDSGNTATGIVRSAFNAKKNAGSGSQWETADWEMRDSILSEGKYPRSVAFKEQRLYLGGGLQNPSRLWASETANIYNFGWFNSFTPMNSTSNYGDSVLQDISSLDFKIAESQEPILHLVATKGLMALTSSGVFSIEGGVERPVSPTNVQIKNQSDIGASIVRPARVQDEMYFVNRSGNKLFSSAYSIERDGFQSSDVSKIANHIAGVGIVDMAYQAEPSSVMYLVLADGSMATLSIDREENVIAWARHYTDGEFESVASIPAAEGNQVWVVVRRGEQRGVELFSPDVVMDSTIQGYVPTGSAIWGGLDHLEGKEVAVVGDGFYFGKHIVTDGTVTISREVQSIQVGLSFNQRIVLLPPEIPSQTGTSQGKNLSINKISAKFLDTIGASINGEPIGGRKFDVDGLGEPLQPFSGWDRVETLGVQTNDDPEQCTVTIEQQHPFNMHVLAVVREVTVND